MLLLLLSVALADLPPPPGFPNPPETCTLEAHAKDGKECKSCDAYYGGPSDEPRSKPWVGSPSCAQRMGR